MKYTKYITTNVKVVDAWVRELPDFTRILEYKTVSGHVISTLFYRAEDISIGDKELTITNHEEYGWLCDLGYDH